MNPDRPKRLRMIAGPNGSGKSSIIRNLAKERSPDGVFWLNHYLNADDVERALVWTCRSSIWKSHCRNCATLFAKEIASRMTIRSLRRQG
ncbi:MAG: hypothetical protein O2820_22920 [Planctomycetota bacterium]|nr:hypothetical protein [Planctomycetota bacterium]MDA1252071.1 hypothetical protein [Planctomycetota bacterium]